MKKNRENKQLSEYWQDRREFLDYPIQTHGYRKCINAEARKRSIKTMRELLKKVPYHELRSDETICDSQAKAFIYFLIYFRCFKMLNLSYPPFKKFYKYIWLGKAGYEIKPWVLGKDLRYFGKKC